MGDEDRSVPNGRTRRSHRRGGLVMPVTVETQEDPVLRVFIVCYELWKYTGVIISSRSEATLPSYSHGTRDVGG